MSKSCVAKARRIFTSSVLVKVFAGDWRSTVNFIYRILLDVGRLCQRFCQVRKIFRLIVLRTSVICMGSRQCDAKARNTTLIQYDAMRCDDTLHNVTNRCIVHTRVLQSYRYLLGSAWNKQNSNTQNQEEQNTWYRVWGTSGVYPKREVTRYSIAVTVSYLRV